MACSVKPTEIDAGNVKAMSNEHNFVFCATAWAGFAAEDVQHIISVLSDFSRFNTVADRMQQGFLNMLLLGRAMIHPQGLSSNAAFQKGGESVLDTTRLFFDGNSQGGIMGGGLTAVAPDFERAALGVPGMNYSTLLNRSVDFDTYAAIIYPNYTKVIDRQLWLSQIQLLWDRGEANGYAHHMTTDPLPDTPRHTVLMHVAFGDHQVSDTAAEVRGPHDRCERVQAGGGPRALAVDAASADPGAHVLPVRGIGDGDVGHRPRPDRGHRDGGHERAAGGEHAEPKRRRPAREPARDSRPRGYRSPSF